MGTNDAAEMLEVAKEECVRLERENARLAATIEAVKAWNDSPPGNRVSLAYILSRTSTSDAVRAIKAEALREAADAWSDWETFRASDGFRSIRQHGKSPDEWLRARAVTLSTETTTDGEN